MTRVAHERSDTMYNRTRFLGIQTLQLKSVIHKSACTPDLVCRLTICCVIYNKWAALVCTPGKLSDYTWFSIFDGLL